LIGDWVGTRTGVDAMVKRKFPAPAYYLVHMLMPDENGQFLHEEGIFQAIVM
jgi:hypothetical protein